MNDTATIVRGEYTWHPIYNTAHLLMMEIKMDHIATDPEVKRVKQPMPLMHMSKRNAQESHNRFAPHIDTIKRMRAEGETFTTIAPVIGLPRNTLSRYYARHKELFK